MKIFVDNDIIIKLAALDILDALRYLSKDEKIEVAYLSSLKYILKNKTLMEPVKDRAIKFLSSCRKIDQAYLTALGVDIDIQDLLANRPGVDPGEAQLLSAALASTDGVFITGDKRCLKALCQSSETLPLMQNLQGRVIILEQLVIGMIDALGFDQVKTTVLKGISSDTAIRASFGSGQAAEKNNVISTLQSYVEEVSAICPNILASTHVFVGWFDRGLA